jgi:hypothetical protein
MARASLGVAWQWIATVFSASVPTSLSAGHNLTSGPQLATHWLLLALTQSQSQVTLRLAVYGQLVRLGAKLFETHEKRLFFQLKPCGPIPYVTSSLTRGYIRRLQLLLAFASAVILRTESRRTHEYFTVSDSRLPQRGGSGHHIYIPPEAGWPNYTPRHRVTVSLPPTTRRATVEVFEAASTWASHDYF